MKRRIHLPNQDYEVLLLNRPGEQLLQVNGGRPRPVSLNAEETGGYRIQLGSESARLRMAVKGETAFIKAFGRTFALKVVDPVEQAAREAGSRGNSVRAPMPGVVVAVGVSAGEPVTRGQPMMTIESMKILTVIAAPRDGRITRVFFEPGQTFDKNAVLVAMNRKEGS